MPENFIFTTLAVLQEMYNSPVDVMVAQSAPVKQLLRRALPGYKKKLVRVSLFRPMTINSYWDGGSRDYYMLVDIASGRQLDMPQPGHPYYDNRSQAGTSTDMAATDERGNTTLQKIPNGSVLIQYGIFMGKPSTAYLYAATEADKAKLLGTPTADVSATDTPVAESVVAGEKRPKLKNPHVKSNAHMVKQQSRPSLKKVKEPTGGGKTSNVRGGDKMPTLKKVKEPKGGGKTRSTGKGDTMPRLKTIREATEELPPHNWNKGFQYPIQIPQGELPFKLNNKWYVRVWDAKDREHGYYDYRSDIIHPEEEIMKQMPSNRY